MRVFLDTNILIDLFAENRRHHNQAMLLKAAQIFGDIELFCSAKSFTDVFYLLHKAGVSSNALQDLFLEVPEYMNICAIDQQDILAAASCKWEDFEDCLIDVCACKCNSDIIITRDVHGFAKSKLPTYDIDDYFEYLRNEFDVIYDEIDLAED